jgi:hypothetical protein
MWKTRCNKLHEATEPTNSNILQLQIHPKIRAIYEAKQSLDHIDQQALQQPIEATLQLPIKQAKNWILQAESFIKQSLQRCQRRLRINTPPITQFFRPTRNSQIPYEHDNSTQNTHTPIHRPRETVNPHAQENLRPP